MPSFSVYFRIDVEGKNVDEALANAWLELDLIADTSTRSLARELHADHVTDEMGEEVWTHS